MLQGLMSRISGQAFAKNMILAKVRRQVVAICDGLGEKRIRWMIENERPLSGFVAEEMIAAHYEMTVEQLMAWRRQWGWAAKAVSDEDFARSFPDWMIVLLRESGEKGDRWLRDVVSWLRGMFSPAG